MNKKVIGITGMIASGKSTAAKYLVEKHGATSHRFSTILRDVATRLHLDINRHNLATLSSALRQSFGEKYIS
jgi:dephospho-CoA kinase